MVTQRAVLLGAILKVALPEIPRLSNVSVHCGFEHKIIANAKVKKRPTNLRRRITTEHLHKVEHFSFNSRLWCHGQINQWLTVLSFLKVTCSQWASFINIITSYVFEYLKAYEQYKKIIINHIWFISRMTHNVIVPLAYLGEGGLGVVTWCLRSRSER